MIGTVGLVAVAVQGLLSLGLMFLGRGMRRRRGLGLGRTVALDNVTLTSLRHGLTCRPDRLVRTRGSIVPEEWKSSLRVWPSHRAQLGVCFVVIEDQLAVRPTHGIIALGDGTRYRVQNAAELRALVLEPDGRIRAARANAGEPILVDPRPGQCQACGMKPH